MRYQRDMRGYGAQPAGPEMAGRRACRRAVRRQLRGRRRELHPARRRGLGSLPVGDRRRRALARHAPLEHGIDLRIRRPRRLLAAAPHVHRRRRSGHRLRRRHRACPLARPGRGDAGGRLGDRLARAEMDRLPRLLGRRRGAPTWKRRSGCTPRSPASGRPAGTPAAPRSTRFGWRRPKAASPMSPTPMTTTCPTGSTMTATATRSRRS